MRGTNYIALLHFIETKNAKKHQTTPDLLHFGGKKKVFETL